MRDQGAVIIYSLGIINLKKNVYHKGSVPIENIFSSNDIPKNSSQNHDPSMWKDKIS
jgi:hypothetical protein